MPQQRPAFTVVIPLYNKGPYIDAALASVRAQSLQPVEVIVVDDGSTDEGPDIVRSWHPFARLLSTGRPRSGPSCARNVGIRAADAEYVAFLDGDDVWHTGFLEIVATALARYPAAAGVFTPCGRFRGTPPELGATLPGAVPMEELDFAAFVHQWVSAGSCPASSSTAAFRRSTLVAAGLFNEDYSRGEDKDAFFRLLRKDSAVHVGIPLGFQRLGVPGQQTRSIPDFMHPVVHSAYRVLERTSEKRTRHLLVRLINQSIWHYAKINRSRRPFPASYLRLFWPRANPVKFGLLGLLYAFTRLRHGPVAG